MTQLISDPVIFFHELGDLHDARIESIAWETAARTITLCVNDLNANFLGLPEYGGQRKVAIIFNDVEDLLLNCDAMAGDTQRIYALEGSKKHNSMKSEWLMQISPRGRLGFVCGSAQITDRP